MLNCAAIQVTPKFHCLQTQKGNQHSFINVHRRLSPPAAALQLEIKVVKLVLVNVSSYVWTLLFFVCVPLH